MINYESVRYKSITGLALISNFAFTLKAQLNEKPNILWIVSEDNSAYFTGCYGNEFSDTPNIDRLAGEGFLYTHAYSPNAVSAPSRNTIITGAYSASNGCENMRSNFRLSPEVHTYPEYLRKAGYYCTNNVKTDYNTISIVPKDIWDESSNKAHYKNRPADKPFFAVFNINISHESCLHTQVPSEKLRHDPEKVYLPPYHPDTPEMRHDWAQYYDKIEEMDQAVGALLLELEKSGEAPNTIVMYYGDNGGVLARSKRFMYETGTHVPLVIRIPEKFHNHYPAEKPGRKVDRLVNFVDFAPTLLSIAGIRIPDYMQGKAFLGPGKTKDPEYAYMSRQRMDEFYDLVRSVRDKKYRYIRNYMPYRIVIPHITYLFKAPSAASWENAFRQGRTDELQSRYFRTKPAEELYDTEKDPWEINNLAENPAYEEVLDRMRKAENTWQKSVRDVGLIPEPEYGHLAGDMSMYSYMRSENCPFDKLMEAADLSVSGDANDIDSFIKYLRSDNVAVRFWGASGLLNLGQDAKTAIPQLKTACSDKHGSVTTLAAEALYNLGEFDPARSAYLRILTDSITYDMYDRNFALNSIDAINFRDAEIISAIRKLDKGQVILNGNENYSLRSVQGILKRWE